MIKTYTVAGLATDKNGNTTVRYANDLDKRLKVLMRDGFTNLNFMFTETPKSKFELCIEMSNLIQFQNDRDLIRKETHRAHRIFLKEQHKQTLFTGTAQQLLKEIQ
jgi:hypothetical protein